MVFFLYILLAEWGDLMPQQEQQRRLSSSTTVNDNVPCHDTTKIPVPVQQQYRYLNCYGSAHDTPPSVRCTSTSTLAICTWAFSILLTADSSWYYAVQSTPMMEISYLPPYSILLYFEVHVIRYPLSFLTSALPGFVLLPLSLLYILSTSKVSDTTSRTGGYRT